MVDLSMLRQNEEQFHLQSLALGIKYELHDLGHHDVRSVLDHVHQLTGTACEYEPLEASGALILAIVSAMSGAFAVALAWWWIG